MYRNSFYKDSKHMKSEIKERMQHKHSRLPSEEAKVQPSFAVGNKKARQVKRTCIHCKDTFLTITSSKAKYCSDKCSSAYRKAKKKEEKKKDEPKGALSFDTAFNSFIVGSYKK